MRPSPKTKTVLITGCSSGFGKLMLVKFLAEGWQVIATTRQPELLEKLPAEGRLHVLPCNVAIAADRQQIVQRIDQLCPDGLDCLINNAGYGLAGPLATLSEEQIRQQFDVNFFAPVLLIRDLLPPLLRAQGRVINISSVLGFTGMPMQSLYVASKFALEGLSESLRYELSPHGIQVALVEPGGFRTGFGQGMVLASQDGQDAARYQSHFQGYQTFLKRMSTRGKGKDPQRVADAVFKLTGRRSMPLRVRVGNDTQGLYYLRRFLPQFLMDLLLGKVSRNILETR
jgi:NAD(P)-dependent dehydrogenase (short-subunit alcohol dehydrogenase family)